MADQAFKDVSVDEIVDTYKKGYITAAQKNDLMRRKAEYTIAEMVEQQGALMSYWPAMVKKVQENWDDFKNIATRDVSKEGFWDQIAASGKAMWAQVGILTAPLNAFGEVNGAKAEQLALKAGASPGLAKVINVAVDVGSGFIPVGLGARSFAKGVQKVGAAVKGKTAATGAAQAGEAGAAAVASSADEIYRAAIARGLQAEGYQGLEGFVLDNPLVGKIVAPTNVGKDFVSRLRQYKSQMSGITATKSHDMTAKEAAEHGLDIEDLQRLVPGKALTESEMFGFLKALDIPVNDLIATAKRAVANEPGANTELIQKLQQFFEYSPKFRAAEVTAGRSVEILKETPPMKAITDMLMGWDPEAIARGDIRQVMKGIAEDIVAMADEPGKLKTLQVLADRTLEGPTFWEMARESYINLLLARPVTQVRNFIGNSYAATTSMMERELGGWLSIDRKNGIVRGEGMAQFQGMMAALADGAAAFGRAFKTVSPEEASKLDFIPHKIPGVLGRIINVPGDTLRGMDNFFKTILTRGDLYAQALNRGKQMGLGGNDLGDFVARHVMAPTDGMMKHAKDFALHQTFQNDLGTYGKHAQRLAQTGPLVYLFPFMKTPMNLAKFAWNRTPGLQLLSHSLYSDILAGGARADMAIGRLTLSNMMGMFWYGLAQQGLITGGGPVDPALRRSWLSTKQPYSLMGKDGWYPLVNLEPGTTPLALVADYAEISNQLDEPTLQQAAMAVGIAGVRDIVDKTYWQTVGQVVDLLSSIKGGEEPGPLAMRVLQGPLVTAVTGGPLGSSFTRATDPVRREARTFLDQIRARIPGWSKTLRPIRDGYGDPILVPQTLGSDWANFVSPFQFREYEQDPLKLEGSRLQVRFPMFPWSLGGSSQDDFDIRAALPGDPLPVELTSEERDRWQVIYRNILRHPEKGLQTQMESEEYKNSPWAAQREMYMNFMATARAAAKDTLIGTNPELQKRMMSARAGRYLPMLTEEQRPQVEQQLEEELGKIGDLPPEQMDNLLKWGILDSGEVRDREVTSRLRATVTKSIPELNKAATGE